MHMGRRFARRSAGAKRRAGDASGAERQRAVSWLQLHIVQSVMGVPGVPGLPPQFSQAFNDAQLIAGLGDKAAWKDGRLTVVKADIAFQLLVQATGSPALATSESLARAVLAHLGSR